MYRLLVVDGRESLNLESLVTGRSRVCCVSFPVSGVVTVKSEHDRTSKPLTAAVENTSLTLLDRLQRGNDSDAWGRVFGLYGPLLVKWLRKYDVQAADADDLTQEVLLAVSTGLKSFDHNGRPGAFRTWLRNILVHRLRNYWRARDRRPVSSGDSDIERRLAQLEDSASAVSQLWDRQHDLFVVQQLLDLSRARFSAETWTAFSRVALNGESPATVARDMGISLNSVFIAKSRVLSRLRQEAGGLVEGSEDSSAIS